MEVKNYKDQADVWYRQIVSGKYQPLSELKEAYEKKGMKTWMNPYDDKKWVLTIKTSVGKS